MDTSYLAQQVNSIVGQLHGLFDEMGIPGHERETREAELFAALSDALSSQVRTVANEKQGMIDEAQSIITTTRQMAVSLEESAGRRDHSDDELKITLPLNRCLRDLKEKHCHVSKLYRERFEQVKKLTQALESYSSHLEPGFVQIALPPAGDSSSEKSPFDLSHAYVDRLDKEFTRVYEEYARRITTVQNLADNIIHLWAELGTPQAQTEPTIVKYYRDAPEQLGLHEEDVARLRAQVNKLVNEKKSREKKLESLRVAVDALWQKLGIDEAEQSTFLNANRGCGVRQINEFEDELSRLNELKRQNMHLFVEDARYRLQELWDALYFSEDEMLEFTPAFSDVYSDALLEAHERELARLEVLKEQRAPMLALVEKYRTLVSERDELATSSQDASRLMMKSQKGEKRDPGKLLREEKMRKRIAKELPKVAADLQSMLEQWEEEYGRPFLVHGERYLDVIEDQQTPGRTPGPRSKTPAGPPPSATKPAAPPRVGALGRANSTTCATTNTTKPQTLARTPTAPTRRMGAPASAAAAASSSAALQMAQMTIANPKGSPTRIPGRPPLANLKYGGSNSPERKRPDSAASEAGGSLRGLPPSLRAPPPKLRDLTSVPELAVPCNPYAASGLRPGHVIRGVDADDVFDDRPRDIRHVRSKTAFSSSMRGGYGGRQEMEDRGERDKDRDPHHVGPRSVMASSHGPFATCHSNLGSQSHQGHGAYATFHSNLSTQSHPVQSQYTTHHSNHSTQSTQSTQSHPGYHTHHHNAHLAAPEECPRPDTALSASYPRQTSDNSSQTSTTMSGSENWETYEDDSEPELDASDTYFAKVRAARGRRAPDPEYTNVSTAPETEANTTGGTYMANPSPLKRYRAPALSHAGRVTVDAEGNRIISGIEWTGEETF